MCHYYLLWYIAELGERYREWNIDQGSHQFNSNTGLTIVPTKLSKQLYTLQIFNLERNQCNKEKYCPTRLQNKLTRTTTKSRRQNNSLPTVLKLHNIAGYLYIQKRRKRKRKRKNCETRIQNNFIQKKILQTRDAWIFFIQTKLAQLMGQSDHHMSHFKA